MVAMRVTRDRESHTLAMTCALGEVRSLILVVHIDSLWRPDAMAKSATKPVSRLLICRLWLQRVSSVQDGGTRVPDSLGFNLDNEEFAGKIPQRKIHILSNNKNNGGIT